MCGIAGGGGFAPEQLRTAVGVMCTQMQARGPDDEGVESFGEGHVCLGNRRLAIIDPSPAGHQPMVHPETGQAIAFNGMIYNFRELAAQLEAEGERFTSDCDTEVILRAYARYGPDCVHHLRGMFAFAIWDPRTREVFLARDRLGIKPLYYAEPEGRLLFSSHVRAILATGLVERRLSAAGVRSFLATGAVADPLTIADGVLSLEAGHRARWSATGGLRVERWWAPPAHADYAGSREDAVRELRERLEEAVRCHLVSDAPLGIFLSGGVDSSLMAGLAARQTDHVRTVSVVFDDDPAFSEERYQRLVADKLGVENVAVSLTGDDLLRRADRAFGAMDQPTIDGLNTLAVSSAAAEAGLKVALSGLGADELFNGYGHVDRVRRLERARALPAPVGRVVGRGVTAVRKDSASKKMALWLGGELPRGRSYELLRSLYLPTDLGRLMRSPAANGIPRPDALNGSGDVFNEVSSLDVTNYMRNMLLRDTDAMSMSVSLEVRVPFVDNELVDWTLRLPGALKDGERKALLVDATRDVLPEEIFTRRKQGFVLPIERWLRSSLHDEVQTAVTAPHAGVAELVDTAAATGEWERFLGGDATWHRPWALYALERWARSALPA